MFFPWCPEPCNLLSELRPWWYLSGRANAIVHKTLATMKNLIITIHCDYIIYFLSWLFRLSNHLNHQTELNEWCISNWTTIFLYLIRFSLVTLFSGPMPQYCHKSMYIREGFLQITHRRYAHMESYISEFIYQKGVISKPNTTWINFGLRDIQWEKESTYTHLVFIYYYAEYSCTYVIDSISISPNSKGLFPLTTFWVKHNIMQCEHVGFVVVEHCSRCVAVLE